MTMTDLSAMSKDDLLKLIAQMQSAPARKLSMKVSAKGALSVYGLGRFPVTLYASQWTRLLSSADDIRAFLDANKALLADDKA